MQYRIQTIKDQNDYWKLRTFLREVLILNNYIDYSWQVAALDYWRFQGIGCWGPKTWEENNIKIWIASDNEIIGFINPEHIGNAFIQINPNYKSKELEEEMIITAEESLYKINETYKEIEIAVFENDSIRKDILQKRGFIKKEKLCSSFRKYLKNPIKESIIPEGYEIRSMGDKSEWPKRWWASWKGFHPDEPDENYNDWDDYYSMNMPLYRRDLDIVAIAPNKEIAAFSTLWYDDYTRIGYFEPIATVPEHQRKGLGKCVMLEAMKRMKMIGGEIATVGGFWKGANALYSSVMDELYKREEFWYKKW